MLEYEVFNIEGWTDKTIQLALNSYAKNGWRLSGITNTMLVFEREKIPDVTEKNTEESRTVTYNWKFG